MVDFGIGEIAMIGAAASAAGGATSAFGSFMGGQASARMYEYQAGVARQNKIIADQNAAYALAAGEVEAQAAGMKTRAQVGETVVAQSGRGFDVGSGSAADVRESEESIGQYNEALIRANAARKAYGYAVEGYEKSTQADIYGMSASGAKTAGAISAAGTLLSTAGTVSSKWLQGQQYFPKSKPVPTGLMDEDF